MRKIKRKFSKYFNIEISHESTRQWVLAAKNMKIIDEKSIVTKTWHIYETYFKIKGKASGYGQFIAKNLSMLLPGT